MDTPLLDLEALPPLGSRVRMRHAIVRYPHFIAPAGAEGTVVAHPDRAFNSVFAVELDDPVPGMEEWEGQVWWDTDQAHYEGVPFSKTVLRDLELLG